MRLGSRSDYRNSRKCTRIFPPKPITKRQHHQENNPMLPNDTHFIHSLFGYVFQNSRPRKRDCQSEHQEQRPRNRVTIRVEWFCQPRIQTRNKRIHRFASVWWSGGETRSNFSAALYRLCPRQSQARRNYPAVERDAAPTTEFTSAKSSYPIRTCAPALTVLALSTKFILPYCTVEIGLSRVGK